ncbi:hypothetical protein RMSM_01233 [Rhodopirellula maiorica SM1]|uniref:Uncharacterized protein n=1 Tax=Rhodopirellula maiorica SM1 TaxID=1265738 RepID=M5RR90_9BACT|nr:hypothetical protein RMSM_01233 [Rhodopirellula maiorica SM1]
MNLGRLTAMPFGWDVVVSTGQRTNDRRFLITVPLSGPHLGLSTLTFAIV